MTPEPIDLSVFSKKVILTDLDGTLANINHRQHFLQTKPRNWNSFLDSKEKQNDLPHEDIIWLVNLLYCVGNIIIVATARSEAERQDSEEWLKKHNVNYHKMFMRAEKDYRDDSIVKEEMLAQIESEYGTPFMVFDDRNRVVDMWRRLGVRCLQVAPGDF